MSLMSQGKIECQCGASCIIKYGWMGMGNNIPVPGEVVCKCGKLHTCSAFGPTREQRGLPPRSKMKHKGSIGRVPDGNMKRKIDTLMTDNEILREIASIALQHVPLECEDADTINELTRKLGDTL